MDQVTFDAFNGIPSITAGYVFKTVTRECSSTKLMNQLDFDANVFNWTIFYNYSISFGEDVPFLMNQITRAIGRQLRNNSVDINLQGVKLFPTLASSQNSADIISDGSAIAFFFILNSLFPGLFPFLWH